MKIINLAVGDFVGDLMLRRTFSAFFIIMFLNVSLLASDNKAQENLLESDKAFQEAIQKELTLYDTLDRPDQMQRQALWCMNLEICKQIALLTKRNVDAAVQICQSMECHKDRSRMELYCEQLGQELEMIAKTIIFFTVLCEDQLSQHVD